MDNAVSEKKNYGNVREHRDIELVKTERRRNYLTSEPNHNTTKFLTEYLLAIEMKKKYRYFWTNQSTLVYQY